MPSSKNIELKKRYDVYLENTSNFILTRYAGSSVQNLFMLRKSLRKYDVKYTIIKNNIFKLSLQSCEATKSISWDDPMRGDIAVVFAKDEFPSIAKQIVTHAKASKGVSIHCGVLGSVFYTQKEIEEIAKLPSREESLVLIMTALNAVSTNIAVLMREIMTQIARGIKAVGEKNS